MARPTALLVSTDGGTFRAVMPSGRNRYFIVGAAVFGVPWLVAVVIAVIFAFRALPGTSAGLVWLAVLLGTTALTALLDVLALALIWLAAYSMGGSETLEMTANEIKVRRRALGITMRSRAKRGHFDRVTLLDVSSSPGREPHPRIEVSGAYSRLRIGSGLVGTEVDELYQALQHFIAEHQPA